jgi:hypothetical protein
MRRFPDLKKAAKRLFMESEPFRAMCEDSQRCSQALRHWEQSTSEEAPVRRKEYSLLLRDLEREILENFPWLGLKAVNDDKSPDVFN